MSSFFHSSEARHRWADAGEFSAEVEQQLTDGTHRHNVHFSLPPALWEATRLEARRCGITQTELFREALVALIGPRIDQQAQ